MAKINKPGPFWRRWKPGMAEAAATGPETEGKTAPAARKSGFGETLRTVIYAVLIALAIRTFAYEPFNIPSGSMIPTLLVGDYLFVSKLSYGYSRHSLPLSPPLFRGRVFFSLPERGDVAVFKLPRDENTDYIKRIIGLPGDRIQMRHGVLFLNGQPVKRERVENYRDDDAGEGIVTARRYRETLPGGKSYYILEFTDSGALDNTPEYLVPEGHVFAMGDNRDRSLDSRVPADPGFGGVGYVPLDNLVGRAEIIFFSTDGSARWWEAWNWPFAIRYDRLLTLIH